MKTIRDMYSAKVSLHEDVIDMFGDCMHVNVLEHFEVKKTT